MKLLAELRAQGRGRDMAAVLAHIPYARFLGIEVDCKGNEITTIMPFKDDLVGNVNLPALYGGAIGALLEITAVIQLLHDTSCERLPKTIDVSVDYLRSGRPQATFGRAIVTRHGRRVANVRSEIWQEDRGRPIGVSHGHYLLAPLTAE